MDHPPSSIDTDIAAPSYRSDRALADGIRATSLIRNPHVIRHDVRSVRLKDPYRERGQKNLYCFKIKEKYYE